MSGSMTDKIIRMEDDENSFWDFLTGKSSSSAGEGSRTDPLKASKEETNEFNVGSKNKETQVPKNSQGTKNGSEDALEDILRKIDDLNRLDNLDESDDESYVEPVFEEDNEKENIDLENMSGKPNTFKEEVDLNEAKNNIEEPNKEADNEAENIKNMSFLERLLQPDVVFKDEIELATKFVGFSTIVVSCMTFYNLVKGYFELRSMAYMHK